MRQLFELCGEDRAICFSPFVWRVLFCLKHKGLEFDRVPAMFLEKSEQGDGGTPAYPTLRDGDTWVSDSLAIAKYLDRTYPENPLFGSEAAEGQAQFLNNWFDGTVVMGLFPMVAAEVCAILGEDNAKYFRETREARLGRTLEEAAANRDQAVEAYRASLGVMRGTLAQQPFLSGDKPGWADYAAAGPLVWSRIVAPDFALFLEDDPIHAWFEKMLDLFDGFARNAPTVA